MLLDTILEELTPFLTDNISFIRFEDCLTNSLYQLKTPNGYFALRVNSPHAKRLGIDRHRELAILEHIKHNSWCLVPTAKSIDYLLTPWIFSKTLEPAKQIGQLTQLIKAVHNVDINSLNAPPLNINEQLELLLRQVPHINRQFEACLNTYRAAYRFPSDLRLCHHDWHCGNLFQTDSHFYLNDWEYAALGDPVVDVVCALQGFSFTNEEKLAFIDQMGLEAEQVEPIQPLVSALAILWYQVRFPDRDQHDNIQAFMHQWDPS